MFKPWKSTGAAFNLNVADSKLVQVERPRIASPRPASLQGSPEHSVRFSRGVNKSPCESHVNGRYFPCKLLKFTGVELVHHDGFLYSTHTAPPKYSRDSAHVVGQTIYNKYAAHVVRKSFENHPPSVQLYGVNRSSAGKQITGRSLWSPTCCHE